MSEKTIIVERLIEQLRAGQTDAADQLMQFTFERLQAMTAKIKRDFDRLGRWEQTDDVLQNASLRLYESLRHVEIADQRHFYRLAALQIRRELIDMCRHHHGPRGLGANHHTQAGMADSDPSVGNAEAERFAERTNDPDQLQRWSELHEAVGELPDQEREVFEMLWYHELSQDKVAETMQLSTRQVKRIWRSAKLRLHEQLGTRLVDS